MVYIDSKLTVDFRVSETAILHSQESVDGGWKKDEVW